MSALPAEMLYQRTPVPICNSQMVRDQSFDLDALAVAEAEPASEAVQHLIQEIARDRRLADHQATIRSAAHLSVAGQRRRIEYFKLERSVQQAAVQISRWRGLVKTEIEILTSKPTPALVNVPDAVVHERLIALSGLLGSEAGYLIFLPPRSREITRVKKSDLSATVLLSVLPLEDCAAFAPPQMGRGHFDVQILANLINRASETLPPYRPTLLRGAGAWRSGSAVIANIGEWLIEIDADGAQEWHPAGTALGQHVWLRQPPILDPQYNAQGSPTLPTGLATRDGRRLAALARAWDFLPPGRATTGHSIAHVVVGWCAIAALGGALRNWRPHLWVTGEHGSGKSELISKFISGTIAGLVQSTGATSEAGVRQELGATSRPHVHDEAEVSDPASRARVEQIIALARSAADPSGRPVRKGTADGRAMEFAAANCFCWASIAPPPLQNADASRIVIARLRAPPPERDIDANSHRNRRFAGIVGAFDDLQLRYAEMGGLAAAVFSRMLRNVHRLNAAEDMFRSALASIGAGGRAVAALAPTLAGAWMLGHDAPPTSAQAASEVTRHWLHGGMRDHLVEAKRGGPGRDIAEAVLALPMRIPTASYGDVTSSVGEALIFAAGSLLSMRDDSVDRARARLQRANVTLDAVKSVLGAGGIALVTPTRGEQSGMLCVALAHSSRLVRDALHGTDMANGWQNALKNIPGILTIAGTRIGGVGGITAYRQPLVQFLGHDVQDAADGG